MTRHAARGCDGTGRDGLEGLTHRPFFLFFHLFLPRVAGENFRWSKTPNPIRVWREAQPRSPPDPSILVPTGRPTPETEIVRECNTGIVRFL